MKSFRLLALSSVAFLCFGAASIKSEAQITVNIGVEPVCPYGYYNYAPYGCAPFGYYGPTWFTGGSLPRCWTLVPWSCRFSRLHRSQL